VKRLTAVLLAICLALVSVPTAIAPVSAADGDYFIFPGEQSQYEQARVVLTSRVDLTGTINQVIGSTITYTVERVVKTGETGGVEQVVQSNPNQTANIILDGNSIRVLSIQLYPGVNKITFKGQIGFTEVSNSIYIEYRNSPALYDLKAVIDGQQFDILEDQSTVVHSALSRNRSSYDIIITGKAPNADRVTVIVNGRSYTYTVNSVNDWTFAASPVNVSKGKNTVTIRVFNGTQSVETTREIVFYNGEVTYYDLQLTTDPNNDVGVSLESAPNYSVKLNDTLFVKGKVVIPVAHRENNGNWESDPEADDFNDANPNPNFKYQLTSHAEKPTKQTITYSEESVTLVNPDPQPEANNYFARSVLFVIAEFTEKLGEVTGITQQGAGPEFGFDELHTLEFSGVNPTKNSLDNVDRSRKFSFYLRDKNKPFIQEVNYFPGFSDATQESQLPGMTGSPLDGATIPALPLGVELLIGNPPGGQEAEVVLYSVNGNTSGDFEAKQIEMTTPVYVTRTVNGVEQQFQRVFLKIDKLPASGTMTLKFQVGGTGGSTAEVRIQLLYGPYVKYDRLYDGMEIYYDTTRSQKTNEADNFLNKYLSNFKGELKNVSNPDEIRYANDTVSGKLQTVFFYINNIEVKLRQEVPSSGTGTVTRFELDPTVAGNLQKAYDAIYKGGENVVKLVFMAPGNHYVSETKFVVIPTNLPEIPAKNTDGIYPYSANRPIPLKNDPNFELRGSVYTTTEAEMNIYGTFDFVDLGGDNPNPNFNSVLIDLQNLRRDGAAKNYILRIQSGDQIITWTLENELWDKDENGNYTKYVDTDVAVPNLQVAYDRAKKSFEFILKRQALPLDGSPKVYTFTVFNTGEYGPRATYRLEVDPTSIPYTILSPRPEKRTVNQNYVEVIILSDGAQSVEIDGKAARKITYLDYSSGQEEEIDAYYALVTGLKANRATDIKFVITNGTQKIQDKITVTYTPENIPGSQYLETMKTKHTPFGNALTLSFERGTNLIRRDYNVAQEYKSQVYTGHNLLFAIANPNDGVVNRHEFESVKAGYDLDVQMGSVYFNASFPRRFVKVSPVFWIDAGEADDIYQTPAVYDPITSGYDPMPHSYIKDEPRKFYYSRDPERELIPSKRGTLTLAYDPSARQSAGVTVTVLRFDPFTRQWENIGGKVDERKNTITVPFDRFGYYVVAKLSASYNDIIDHKYARNAMEAVFAKGIMNAMDPSGSFGGDQYVTRGEFTRMIVRALELPLNYEGQKHFMDIGDTNGVISPDALWDYRYIETAARAGIVKGTRPETFDPTTHISRQDAAVMLANALNLKQDTNYDAIRKQLQKAFKDEADITVYAKPAVAAIQKKGFITGAPVDANDLSKGYVFEPTARLLRSDAAIIIARVMADQKKLPKIFAPQQ